jgi:hypothetical protein
VLVYFKKRGKATSAVMRGRKGGGDPRDAFTTPVQEVLRGRCGEILTLPVERKGGVYGKKYV